MAWTTLEALRRAFEDGVRATGLAHPGESVAVEKIGRIVAHLPATRSSVAYAYTAGRNAAIDALRRRKAAEKRDAETRRRTEAKFAFVQADAAQCEALEGAIARAALHWFKTGEGGEKVPQGLDVIRALFIHSATDEDIQAMMPGASQNVRHQRKRRAVVYVLKHGQPCELACKLLNAHAARVRKQRNDLAE